MAKLKITQTDSSGQIHDRYQRPGQINGAYVGGTGGLTSQTGRQIQGQSYINGASSQQCSILAQKGAHKFRVQDANGAKGTCTLVNSPNPTAGQMNVLLTLNSATASIAAANVAGGATSTTVTLSSVTGPVALPRVGDWLSWTSPSANISNFVQVTGVNGSTITIGASGNVAAASGVSVTTNTYASKINNKYVWDWTSDGQQDSTSGTVTFMTSGYNPNRYRYHLAAADATFIQVQYA
jgi:hypothetical protein